MSTLIQKIQVKRGTNKARSSITPDMGELIYTTDTKRLYIGDGATVGGIEVGALDNIEALETKVNSLENILRSNDVNLDSLQEVVNFVKNNKSELAALKSISVINNLTSTSTTNPLSANQGKVLDDKINTLAEYQGKVLDGKITNLQDQGNGLDGKITNLENQGRGLDGKITNLENQGNGLDGKITTLENQGNGLDVKITNLENQGKGLDGKITNLVNSKQDNITGIEGGSF